MDGHWVDRACRALLAGQADGGGWGYRDGASSAAEPTAMAGLGLLATGDAAPEATAADRAGKWLAGHQRGDGSIPAVPGTPAPGWATPQAMILWSRLGAFADRRRRARDWLLGIGGRSIHDAETRKVLGHDPTLIGWPWVVGTHSWLEPTALAILALAAEGCHDHARVRQGLDLIADRALPDGGWNYGNKIVFGQALRPQPGPTGAALLALAAGGRRSDPVVTPAVAYLRRTLPATHAAVSVGWGVLGLRAHDAAPPESATWLERAHDHAEGRPDATLGTALLLLAAGPRAGL